MYIITTESTNNSTARAGQVRYNVFMLIRGPEKLYHEETSTNQTKVKDMAVMQTHKESKMIQAAEYLGCVTCVCAAAEAVTKLAKSILTPADINTVVRVALNNLAAADPTTGHMQAQCVRALCNLAKRNLLPGQELHEHDAFKTLFGDALKILLDETLKSLFCSLPLPAIIAWGSMDDLIIDAEDTVAILLVHWMNTELTVRSTEAVKSELSDLIRYPFISHSCLHYLIDEKQLEQKGSAIISKPRVLSSQDHLELLWEVSLTDIQSCVETGKKLNGPHGYWAGFDWNVYINPKTDQSQNLLGMYVQPRFAGPGSSPGVDNQPYISAALTVESDFWNFTLTYNYGKFIGGFGYKAAYHGTVAEAL